MTPFRKQGARAAGLAVVALVAVSDSDARACATAPPQGASVSVAEESAIIVWDEAKKTEHFIRRASFRSETNAFGFLVPTPTKPELAEANDDVFRQLDGVIRPETIFEDVWRLEPTLLVLFPIFMMTRSASAPAVAVAVPPVRVLEEKRVGGYDAAVLEADDAAALAEWLKSHGYAKRPALEEWLAPYVAKKWKLTAFKVADGDARASDGGAAPERAREPVTLGTGAVRMSFQTERPFFPYREPRDQREGVPASVATGRSLRVFYFGPARVTPVIGDGSTAFPGKTPWSAPFQPGHAALPVAVEPGGWLTVIEDNASPRPGVDELWLDRSKDPAVVKPPPVIVPSPRRIPVPLDVLAIVAVAGVVIVRRRTSRRYKASP